MAGCDPSASTVAALATSGPRYTSYPPATEFRALAPGLVADEVTELGEAGAPVGLYVHVPFCRSLCWYCGCNVIPTRDQSRGDGYVEDLRRELATLRQRVGARLPLVDLALGGGSPNFLSIAALTALMGDVRSAFAVTSDARLSIELDPRTTDTAQIEALAGLGFRAASLGVQDFAPAVQVAIHRHQSFAQTEALMQALRTHGFDDVNLDLVYGLPQQTEATLAATLTQVIALAPDRIALFGYAHLPERLPHQRLVERAGPVPDAAARAGFFLRARTQLLDAGYVAVGLDHFARPGSRLAVAAAEQRLARTFQGYVERRGVATLGLGVSAITSTPRLIAQAPVDLEAWRAAVMAGTLPVARGVVLDADDRLRGQIIEALMCDGAVDLGAVARAAGCEARAAFATELGALAGSALVDIEPAGPRLVATPLGRVLIRNVCQVFDRRTPGGAARFSPTV